MASTNSKGSLGVKELGRIIDAIKGEIQGTTLQIPTIGYHTVEETTTKKSILTMIDVLRKLYLEGN